jgi:hypothetical protein
MTLHPTHSLGSTAALRYALRSVVLGLTLVQAACSSAESAKTGAGGTASGGEAGGKSNGAEAGGPATGGGNGTGGMAQSGRGGTDTMSKGGAVAQGYANPGLLRQSGKATVSASDYAGTEEYHIVSEGGLGTDVCDVKFDVKRVGAVSAPCQECDWSHLVELSNPEVVVDENGACAANDCEPIAGGFSKIAGLKIALGFSKKTGHGDQLMHFDEAKAMWLPVGRGNWDESSGSLGYTIAGSVCTYGE